MKGAVWVEEPSGEIVVEARWPRGAADLLFSHEALHSALRAEIVRRLADKLMERITVTVLPDAEKGAPR